MKLNLGCGSDVRKGWVNVDLRRPSGWREADSWGSGLVPEEHPQLPPRAFTQADLRERPWPFPSGEAERILARHVVEHLPDPVPFFEEAWRVAKPGAVLEVAVPPAGSPWHHRDPTHRTSWVAESFRFMDPEEPGRTVVEGPWRLLEVEKVRACPSWPLAWHLREHLGLKLGPVRELRARLEKRNVER